MENLIASVMNWQPSGDFFRPAGDAGPLSPLALTPGLLNILSEG
jgi:hypothetical protein